MTTEFYLRLLAFDDMREAAKVHRIAFDDRLPWLSGLHSPDEDLAFYQQLVVQNGQIWGAFAASRLVGIIAFREGWIDQLYVLPDWHGRGAGSALLKVPLSHENSYSLWTFQRNLEARGFYEKHGFVAVEETDGSANEEREPDVRYFGPMV